MSSVFARLLDANDRFDLANRGTVNHLPMALFGTVQARLRVQVQLQAAAETTIAFGAA